MKKVLKIVGITILSIILLLFLAGFLFGGKIGDIVKSQINKNVEATVDFDKVSVSFLKSFPNVSVGTNNISVVTNRHFDNDTLFAAKDLHVSVDLMSFLKGDEMRINKILINYPRVHALLDENGIANWDIAKETSEDTTEKGKTQFQLQLKQYEINNAYIFYQDKEGGMKAEITGLNHKGSGDFTSDQFLLSTHTDAKKVTFYYGLIPYLFNVNTDIDTDIQVDNKTNTYTFRDFTAMVNALKLTAEGSIVMKEDAYDIDVSFDAPGSGFKDILSLVPVVYKQDFNDLKADGVASFKGNVKGVYSETSIPGYDIALKVNKGAFKYADLPIGVDQVDIDARVNNPDGVTDHTVVNIDKSSFRLGGDNFDFRMLLRYPVTTQYIDATANGTLDLGKVSQFVKLEKGTDLSGILKSDLTVRGNIAELEKQQYQNFYSAGTIDVNNFKYRSNDYPEGVEVTKLSSSFTPSVVRVSDLSGKYLGTNFSGNADVNNLMNYLFSNQPLKANISVKADKVDLNKFMGISTDTATAALASTATGSESSSNSVFVVPANLDVRMNAQVGEVDYDKLDIHDLSGTLRVANQTIYLDNIKGNALDGTMAINGTYSTQLDKKNPDISINYDIEKVDIQKAFYAFNTAQKLMPIGKFLAGKMTSSLNARGKLADGMELDMNTLSGNGDLLLIEGVLSKFAPLDKIASTLNVSQLENISMRDVKTFIEFTNGKILVKPFNLKVGDVQMEIGGLQGIDQSIDYSVNLKLPRKLMGTKGNDLVNNLAAKVSKAGVPVDLGETVNLMLKLGGTFQSPTIKTDLKQTGESLVSQFTDQVKEFAQEKADNLKQATKDSVASLKQKALESAKSELTKKLLGQVEPTGEDSLETPKTNIGKEAEKTAKGLIQGLFGKKKKEEQPADTTKEK